MSKPVALSSNDDNDKSNENRGKRKRDIRNRVDITHTCKHKSSYPSNPKFDYSIKSKPCPMCQEWDNPEKQLEEEGYLI